MRPTTEIESQYEHQILTTESGRLLLAEVESIASPGPRDLARWRRDRDFETVSAALRIATTRRKSLAKFALGSEMWFDPLALEQATSEAVARHKASRFRGRRTIDLCCGIGGDTLALAEVCPSVVAVDRDRGMLRRLLWNGQVYRVEDRILAIQGDAERTISSGKSAVHIDPDRRANSPIRSKSLLGYAPRLEFLLGLSGRHEGGAIKVGPASDFEEHFPSDRFEIEVISLHGECKEATAWFGDLRTKATRRATVLPSGATWTDLDGPTSSRCPTGPISGWIHEPNPSLIRSGLLDGFAMAHDLTRFSAGIDLLSSDARIDSPMLASFEVESCWPLDLRVVKQEVMARGLGRLEIKTRGVSLLPEDVRRSLRVEGENAATLFLIGGRERGLAVIARRPEQNDEKEVLS